MTEPLFGDLDQALAAFKRDLVAEDGILALDDQKYIATCKGEHPKRIATEIQKTGGISGQILIATFIGPPYGYPSDLVRACCAGLLRGKHVRIRNEAGDEITSYRDAGVKDLFTKDRTFRKAEFFPPAEDPITGRDRIAIGKFFEAFLDAKLDREDEAFADAAFKHFPHQREALRDVERRFDELPGRPALPERLSKLAKALEDCYRHRPIQKIVVELKRNGDVPDNERKRFKDEPAEILMTTPESLEVMLVSPRFPVARIFKDLRLVVIDEVHAMAGTDRGAHLLSVLERLATFTPNDVQRVGLSATVGNPDYILSWLQGSSKREGIVVDPPKQPTTRNLHVGVFETTLDLAGEASARGAGKKSLFFCQSRALTESVAERMRGRGTDVFVHHSSVSLEERRAAEERFHGGTNACIVCTSTLELGIDVGDLDLVFQANAPSTVSSFLQRMGRTGRRAGSILEASLLDVLGRNEATARTLLGKKWPERASLKDLIEAAGSVRVLLTPDLEAVPLLPPLTAAKGAVVTDHRDLIHPRAEVRGVTGIDEHTVATMRGVLGEIARDLRLAHERGVLVAFAAGKIA